LAALADERMRIASQFALGHPGSLPAVASLRVPRRFEQEQVKDNGEGRVLRFFVFQRSVEFCSLGLGFP